LNRYAGSPLAIEAISCDRCHGPADAHLQQPSRKTILNPAELQPELRDSICEQCHLSGSQRVLNPGWKPGAFEPGLALEEALTVYVPEGGGGADFKVVSHSERLALSRCFRESAGAMWCGTCHDPHADSTDARADFIRKCETCHVDLTAKGHGAPTGDCVACHMARRKSHDSGHSAFTDHAISVRREVSERDRSPASEPLRAWREPAAGLRERNLGIAYARRAETSASIEDARRARRLLTSALTGFPDDADVVGGLGMSLLLMGASRDGTKMLERAIALEPANPLRYPPAAAAQWQLGEDDSAMETLRAAIEADPYYLPAYRMLAHILSESGQRNEARKVWASYLLRVPQSVNARLALEAFEEPHAR
jgi:hypothetical protein